MVFVNNKEDQDGKNPPVPLFYNRPAYISVWGAVAMGRKIRLKKKIMEALDLPLETVLDVPRLIVLGNERVLVENHKGIYEYYPNFVRLQTGIGILKVTGEELMLKELSAQRLYVDGKIASFEYENKV